MEPGGASRLMEVAMLTRFIFILSMLLLTMSLAFDVSSS